MCCADNETFSLFLRSFVLFPIIFFFFRLGLDFAASAGYAEYFFSQRNGADVFSMIYDYFYLEICMK